MQAAQQLEEVMLVTEMPGRDEAYLTEAVELSPDGMVVRKSAGLSSVGRHAWLEFALPTTGRVVRALAEVIGQGPSETRYRFKHLWPRDRSGYQEYVAARA